MYIKYNDFILESKKITKDLEWFSEQLGLIDMSIVEYMGVSKNQRRQELEDFIHLKKVISFLTEYKVRFGEVFNTKDLAISMDIELSWTFMTPWGEDQTSDPVYILYKEKDKLIKLAMVSKDDYNIFKPLNDIEDIKEGKEEDLENYFLMKRDIELLLSKIDKLPDDVKESSRKRLIYMTKELVFLKKTKSIKYVLPSKERIELDYDNIKITNNIGNTKNYSWGELDKNILIDIIKNLMNNI